MIRLLHLVIFLGMATSTLSQDIYGGEIFYDCLGNDKYEVTLIKYGKCTNNHFGTTEMKVKCGSSGQTLLTKSVNPVGLTEIKTVCASQCSKCISPGCSLDYGYRKYIYKATFDLSSFGTCCGVYFYNEGQNRASTITTGLANQSFYIEAYLDRCVSPCNSSPEFKNDPVMLYNQGVALNFHPGVYDLDANERGVLDSVSFEMGQPKGLGGVNLSYAGSYAYDKPIYFWGFPNKNLPVPRGLHFGNENGDFFVTPMNREETVLVLKMKEFRDGVLVGEVTRDFVMTIDTVNMLNRAPSVIASSSNTSGIADFEVCVGDTLRIEYKTQDFNTNDQLNISYNQELDGVNWTDNNGQTDRPSGNFLWVPGDDDVGKPFRFFTVSVSDGHCPIPAISTYGYTVLVKPRPITEIKLEVIGCGYFRFIAKPEHDTTVTWTGDVFKKIVDTAFELKYNAPGLYDYSVHIPGENGCDFRYSNSLDIKHTGPVRWVDEVDTACADSSFYYLQSYPVKVPDVSDMGLWFGTGVLERNDSFFFNPGDSAVSTNKLYELAYVEADTLGCLTYDTLRLYILNNTKPYAGEDMDACRYGPEILLNASPGNGIWLGPGITGNRFDPVLPVGNYELIYRIDKNGRCPESDTLLMRVNPKPVADFGVLETHGIVPLDVHFIDSSTIDTGKIAKYLWNFGDGDTSGTSGNVMHTYLDTGDFSVILLVTSDKGCTDFKSRTALIDVWSVGINEKYDDGVVIYPNPFEDELFLTDYRDIHSVKVYDPEGRKVFHSDRVNRTRLQLPDLKKGIYIMILEYDNDQEKVVRIIKSN